MGIEVIEIDGPEQLKREDPDYAAHVDGVAKCKARYEAPGPFKVQVIADSSGRWSSNSCRFLTICQAEQYGRLLAQRWALVRQWRVVDVDGKEVPKL